MPKERVDSAVEQGRAMQQSPERVLLEAGALGADQLARATAERFGLDHVDLTVYKPDIAAVNLLGAPAERRYNAVPIGFHNSGNLLVAMADPSNVLALDDLKLMTGYEIRPVVGASAEDIASLIAKMNRLDDAVAEAVDDEDEEDDELVGRHPRVGGRRPGHQARQLDHRPGGRGRRVRHPLRARGRDMRVRFRIDGVLREATPIPRRMVAGVVSRVKIMADLDIAERRMPQDGRVGLVVEGHAWTSASSRCRASTARASSCASSTRSRRCSALDALGIRRLARKRFEARDQRAYGAVLVTGPTGSGKSTTLYAALNAINSVEKNIITIEDPVEYQLPGINQIQVNLEGGADVRRRPALDAARRPRTSSWSARSATARRPRSRSSPRSPATSSSRRCTRTTRRRRSPASPRWASSRS